MKRKVNKKAVFVTFALLVLMFSVVPADSWVYQDDTPEDTKFEKFGPRADRLLIKLYESAEAEWDALEAGEIDITNWPLSEPYYDRFTTPPLNESINVVGYGPEFSFLMLDINNNDDENFGDPPNPVYPNPCGVLSFRQAIAHLINRTWLDTIIGSGFYVPIWVPMSPALGKYYLNITNPYPYNPTMAENLLDADGFPINPETGWRFWDRNGNGEEDPDEYLELKFVIRSDHAHLLTVGDLIADELENAKVRVNRIYATYPQALTIVVYGRDFHLYTGTYRIDEPDPTYLFDCFESHASANYNGINDPTYDEWAWRLVFAETQDEAVFASHNAQQVFVDESFKVPLWVYNGYKAMYRRYTGGSAGFLVMPDDGENQYRNQSWQGTVNIAGYGIDNFFSFLNMHPTGYAYGHNENMTIRYGFAHSELHYLNPVYAKLPYEWQVLNLIYERLIRRDPYNITEWMPWMVKNFTVDTYIHPVYGECTKVNFTMRTDITWQDGTPLTTADVEFTLTELDDILLVHGYPPPSWYSNVAPILSLEIFDPYNFEVLFDVKSYWALSWIGNTPILPKHIWKPIVETGEPDGFAPDPNLTGSGPWRLKEYVAYSHILMVANKPGNTVTTNLPGSTPITSPEGYFQLYPVYADIHFKLPYEYRHKIPLELESIEYKVTLENLIREQMIIENITNVNLTSPTGSEWNETWPTESVWYLLVDWIDNGDAILSPSDVIGIAPIWTPIEWYHIENMWWEFDPIGPEARGVWILELKPVVIVNKHLYIDDLALERPRKIYLKPEISHEQQRIFFNSVGLHTIRVAAHIKEPDWDCWKLNCTWINYTFTFWVTIKEDIVGSTLYDDIGFPTYPYKIQLPSPDFKVDIRDIAYVARAFGSYPGHPRWKPCADINCDYRVDIIDVAIVARKYGWVG